ncbi:hypothetical protein STEG23_033857, partial [Scotinomys teguina]
KSLQLPELRTSGAGDTRPRTVRSKNKNIRLRAESSVTIPRNLEAMIPVFSSALT